MKRSTTLVLTSLLLVTAGASADTLSPGGNSVGKITRVSKGVKELSLETQLVFHSDTVKGKDPVPDTTTTDLSVMGAPVFRYFVVDNLNLGLHLGGFFKSSSTKTGDSEVKAGDVGFIGSLSVAYNLSLGGGMFISPLVGGGYFAGSREVTTPDAANGPDIVIRSSLSGGVGRGGLGLVFYPSARFNLFARPEAIMYFGSAKEKDEARPANAPAVDPDAHSFSTIDAGFTCGASYIF